MSSLVSSALVLVLFIALAAPAALGGVGGGVGKVTTAFYAVLLVGVLVSYSSLPGPPPADVLRPAGSPDRAVEDGPCEDALAAAQRSRVVLDRSSPDKLVVDGKLWQMLPETVRSALSECASQVGGDDGQGTPVEVVERAG